MCVREFVCVGVFAYVSECALLHASVCVWCMHVI